MRQLALETADGRSDAYRVLVMEVIRGEGPCLQLVVGVPAAAVNVRMVIGVGVGMVDA